MLGKSSANSERAQSGLGPGPGWGPYGPLWALRDRSWQVRTCPNHTFDHDFWSNLTRFGFKIRFLTKFLDDSAWFLLEKLKKHVILTQNPNIWPKIQKIFQKSLKLLTFLVKIICFFELLRQKPCIIINKFRQKYNFGPETCEIKPKVGNRTCPDLPRPVY